MVSLSMKNKIREIIKNAAMLAHEKGLLPSADFPDVNVEVPKLESHGDFSTNMAMLI